jgi:hypothetical protein
MQGKLKDFVRFFNSILFCALLSLSCATAANARFLTPDTWDPFLAGVDINRYAYGANDPINMSDPNGHMMGTNPFLTIEDPEERLAAVAEARASDAERMASIAEAMEAAEGPLDAATAIELSCACPGEITAPFTATAAFIARTMSKAKVAQVLAKEAAALKAAAAEARAAANAAKTGGALVPKSTVSLGRWGEARLNAYLGGKGYKPAKPFPTSTGYRYVDRLVDGIAYESKAGSNVGLTPRIREQIAKDAELIREGRIEGAEWHFWNGAQKELLDALKEEGIKAVVH